MSSVSEDKSSRKKKVGVVKSGYLAFNDELVPEDNDLDCFAACSDPVPAPLPKSNRMSSVVNRRRSSMGIAGSRRGSISEAEQVRIVDMYKTVIQMSSENVSIQSPHSYSLAIKHYSMRSEIDGEKFVAIRSHRSHGATDQGRIIRS